MPRKNRLSGAEIRRVRAPRRVHGTYFSLSIAPTQRSGARFAFVVPKKVAAKAVTRNLIKRRCRDIVVGVGSDIPQGAYIFYAKKSAENASRQALLEDISKLLGTRRSARS